MTYTLAQTQPGPRDPNLPYDALGPGLYSDEVAVNVDLGNNQAALVAVSTETELLANGSGLSFKAFARNIEADGQTKLFQGKELETGFTYCADAATVNTYGVAAISKEVMLLVLGQEPTKVDKPDPDGGSPVQEPMIVWGSDVRLNASIINVLACVSQVSNISNASNILFP